MKILSKEKVKVLAERNGWSLSKAEGYVDGETFRRRGKAPSSHVRIGIDDYSLGFRAGFYDRQVSNTPNRSPVALPVGVSRSPVDSRQHEAPADLGVAIAHGS